MIAISQKSQYAVRAVFELARRQGQGPIKLEEIAQAQAVPARFLANIFNQLRAARLIDSLRGKNGGYILGREPKNLRVGDIIRCMEGSLATVDCRAAGGKLDCPLSENCFFLPLWKRAQQAAEAVYDGTTYQDLLEEEERMHARRNPAAYEYTI